MKHDMHVDTPPCMVRVVHLRRVVQGRLLHDDRTNRIERIMAMAASETPWQTTVIHTVSVYTQSVYIHRAHQLIR